MRSSTLPFHIQYTSFGCPALGKWKIYLLLNFLCINPKSLEHCQLDRCASHFENLWFKSSNGLVIWKYIFFVFQVTRLFWTLSCNDDFHYWLIHSTFCPLIDECFGNLRIWMFSRKSLKPKNLFLISMNQVLFIFIDNSINRSRSDIYSICTQNACMYFFYIYVLTTVIL